MHLMLNILLLMYMFKENYSLFYIRDGTVIDPAIGSVDYNPTLNADININKKCVEC